MSAPYHLIHEVLSDGSCVFRILPGVGSCESAFNLAYRHEYVIIHRRALGGGTCLLAITQTVASAATLMSNPTPIGRCQCMNGLEIDCPPGTYPVCVGTTIECRARDR